MKRSLASLGDVPADQMKGMRSEWAVEETANIRSDKLGKNTTGGFREIHA
jgi:hypothetical protein